jgi:tRNA modification GTPase
MQSGDTIVAVSTAAGAGARMIVRVSGPGAHAVARELTGRATLEAGRAVAGRVWPGVGGWVYAFAGPRSYTGEDLVEFHVPGNPVLGRMLLARVVEAGARQAEPGEFTARAYFNGRMDLTQAEGVAATIGAQSDRELRAARQLLAGELARRLTPVMESVAQALALVEVGIDFTDEDVTFISAEDVRARCGDAVSALERILNESGRFERLAHEPRVVLVGRPNAGKSTLLNALAGRHRAVVSPVAGTTRDAIWAEVALARGMVRVVDVAGIDEAGGAAGEVERQMREQAMREVGEADLVVMVEDSTAPVGQVDVGSRADLVVRTKGDLGRAEAGGCSEGSSRADKNVCPTDLGSEGSAPADRNGCPTVVVSAMTGEGMDDLRRALDGLAFGTETGGGGLALNARHVRAIAEAREALGRACGAIDAGGEVVAMELREGIEWLGGVLGRMSPDDLLGRIFSEFCIGK